MSVASEGDFKGQAPAVDSAKETCAKEAIMIPDLPFKAKQLSRSSPWLVVDADELPVCAIIAGKSEEKQRYMAEAIAEACNRIQNQN